MSGSSIISTIPNLGGLVVGGHNASTVFAGVYAGGGSLTKNGNGALTLAGINTFSGGTTVNAGTLQITNVAMAANTYNIASGATLELTMTTTNPFSGATTFTNTGTLKLDGGGSVIAFGKQNNAVAFPPAVSCTVSLAAGGLVWITGNTAVVGSYGNNGNWNSNLGSFQVDSGSSMNFVEAGASHFAQFDALNGGGAISGGSPAITLSLGNANGTGIFSGSLSGLMSLTKNGTGAQTLSGANSYTGATTINGGTLALGANNTLPSGTAVSLGSATLDAQTYTNSGGALNVTGAGTINLGSGGTLAFTNSSAANWTGGTLAITGSFVSSASLRFGTDNTGLTSGQLAQISAAGYNSFSLDANGYLVGSSGGGLVSNTLALAAVPSATVGYQASVFYTATVQTNGVTATNATGPVVFSYSTYGTNPAVAFWTNNCVAGVASSVTIANQLPRGTNLIIVGYASDGIYLGYTNSLIQTVTNHPPVVSNITMGGLSGTPATIQIIGGKYAPTDADGDPLIVSAVQNPSVQNGTVTTDGTNVTYTALGNFTGADTFTYSVSDNYGGTSTAVITVNVVTNGGGYNLISGPVNNGNGTSTIHFAGIPGYSYALETTPSLTLPITWTPVQTNTAASNGALSFTFSTSAGQGYFRTHYVP